ncbi:MAG: zincin-like metallopeptidase domain-containing protein [Capsulimonadaceae bacterium]|nr:zincin-like metallopeptidase domain-containing protein [Capsulimonadaceae bacterium]
MENKYDEITNRILAELDKGVVPWRKPWTSRTAVNAVSEKPYRGINSLLLGMAGYDDHRWLTFKQAHDLNGQVRRGEKGTAIVFWQFIEHEGDDDEQKRSIPLARAYTVFNVQQCERLVVSEGGKLPDLEPISASMDASALEAARNLLEGYPDAPKVLPCSHAAYAPARDVVLMPSASAFNSKAGYTATLAHELVHSTGHNKRLNRPGVVGLIQFASQDYSFEELLGELGACFLCAEIGVANDIQNSASYIEGWRQRLSTDSRLIVRAASQAQKAADWVLGRAQE